MLRLSWLLGLSLLYSVVSLAVAFSSRSPPLALFVLFTALMVVLLAKRSVEDRALIVRLVGELDATGQEPARAGRRRRQ